ncbi:MAG TPA: small ribosomal subunit Rsm22 family protein [Phycisphaerales bacterium]|nr:small ribosomal subunit Rsm22 family protein [Phycisphaerales bacterium]HMP38029.1 small ribosomal subunit Rsm22 family protein [Phycisphaerales bacterium]
MTAIVDSATFRSRLETLERLLWKDGCAGIVEPPRPAEIVDRVLELSDLYTVERDLIASLPLRRGHLSARVLYFLCADAPKVHLVLDELRSRRAGPHPAPRRVLDLGAGVGATAAGLLLSLAPGTGPIEIIGIDRDGAALQAWRTVVDRCAEIAGIEVAARALEADLAADASRSAFGGADLAVAQAVLNETLDGGTAPRVAPPIAACIAGIAGSMETILIEPALRIATRPLHGLRDDMVARGIIRVLAPCLHEGPCPMLTTPRDWCHEVRHWPPTPRVAEIQSLTRRRDDRVRFSFVATSPRRGESDAAAAPGASAATAEAADRRGAHAAARIVSDALASKGKVERWLCCADGVLRRVRLLDRERTESNAAIARARRGALLTIEGLPPGGRVDPSVRVAPLLAAGR